MVPGWRTNFDASIPCLPQDHGGCGYTRLDLRRIFKLNWVAKLVKILEEMVNGCKVNDASYPDKQGNDNHLYCPSSEDLKAEGIVEFRMHWAKAEPVIVKQVYDASLFSSWDPVVIWKQMSEISNERMSDADRVVVKAIDCLDWSRYSQFMEGYTQGHSRQDGWPEMLKLKDWPSPSACEEFFSYQRPEFISQLLLVQFIHSKWGLLNVAAKMLHYSLQNDGGPKISLSYGMLEEGRGDSVSNLHLNMRDMVYILVHTSETKLDVGKRTTLDEDKKASDKSETKDSSMDPPKGLGKTVSPSSLLDGHDHRDEFTVNLNMQFDATQNQQHIQSGSVQAENSNLGHENGDIGTTASLSSPGILWHVFRREDAPKLNYYSHSHCSESKEMSRYDDAVYLNKLHGKVEGRIWGATMVVSTVLRRGCIYSCWLSISREESSVDSSVRS